MLAKDYKTQHSAIGISCTTIVGIDTNPETMLWKVCVIWNIGLGVGSRTKHVFVEKAYILAGSDVES